MRRKEGWEEGEVAASRRFKRKENLVALFRFICQRSRIGGRIIFLGWMDRWGSLVRLAAMLAPAASDLVVAGRGAAHVGGWLAVQL